MSKEAVVMVVYDTETQQVLSEERTRPDRAYYGERIFLSGLIEDAERDDPSVAARRELNEELGIEAVDFHPLQTGGPLIGDLGEKLFPYLISKWEGEVPATVIDSNNPLVWDSLEEATQSSVASRVAIAKLAMSYLSQDKL